MTGWRTHDPAARAPLAAVRVLDFSELLPGPFFTQGLADMGADVIKVERPAGDPARRSSPALFATLNGTKRSLSVDLKTEDGRAAVRALLFRADVLVETFRPGVMARLGFGYEAVREKHPALVYVSLTGYGSTGPHAHRSGHDINYLAASGVADLATPAAGGLPSFGIPVADLAGAMYALAATNAALLQRTRTGVGQRIDVSLADCMVHATNTRLPAMRLSAAGAASAAGDGSPERNLKPRAAYGFFTCRDGRVLSVAALEDHFWAALVQVLGMTAFAGDGYARRDRRDAQAPAINAALAAVLSRMDGADVRQRLADADVPVFEVVGGADLPTSPQAVARGLFQDSPFGPVCRFPVRLDGMDAAAAPLTP